jgi:hypothetical protein
VVVVFVTLVQASPAQARRSGAAIVNTGDDLIHIRDLPADTTATLGVDAIGYRYERVGVFWLDLWRWDGEFVVYKDNGYIPLDDDTLATLGGGSVPWKYHFPPGLLLVLAIIEFVIVAKTKRRARGVLAIGGALVLFGIVILIGGVDKAFAIPLLLGGYHIFVALPAVRAARAEAAATPEAVPAPRESGKLATVSGSHPRASVPRMTSQSGSQPVRPSAPSVEAPRVETPAEPARPSQPLAIARPQSTTDAPTKHDDSAAAPKFLR